MIDKENSKLLQRIVDIMTSKKKTFPVTNNNETKRKVKTTSQVAHQAGAHPGFFSIK